MSDPDLYASLPDDDPSLGRKRRLPTAIKVVLIVGAVGLVTFGLWLVVLFVAILNGMSSYGSNK